MKLLWLMTTGVAMLGVLTGCETVPPGADRGPHGTIAYEVLIEASDPGARVEVNGESVGNTPIRIKIYGDKDGTFHDFGSYFYVIRALPVDTNQFVQTRMFGTGRAFTPQDRIPERVYFDMQQNTPTYPPDGNPAYAYPPPPYPYYYYGRPYYYGPSFRYYYGPGPYRRPYYRHY
jgi:hypothetical protein